MVNFCSERDYPLNSAANQAVICILQCVNDKKIEMKRLLMTHGNESEFWTTSEGVKTEWLGDIIMSRLI